MELDFPADLDDLPYWLALYRVPGVGSVTFQHLLEAFGSPRAVLEASRANLTQAGLDGNTADQARNPDWEAVEGDLKWLAEERNHLLTLASEAYPTLLREIPAPPPLLFVHGDPDALSTLQLAMVGSRNPSPGGAQTAYDFARHLAAGGLTVTSGLALGIDAASHEGALAENFPRRNRIISGLSLGTLVVEAALRSGSLITARHALDQGREVFAIPGSIHNPLARGCHQLIRQGAKLVETADDILSELAPLAGASLGSTWKTSADSGSYESGEEDTEHQAILEQVGFEPTPVDVLVRRTGLTPEELSSILLILELRGHVASCPGGGYARVLKRGIDERKCP
jgi:DNA processing protein